MRNSNKLTELKIKQAKPKEKQYKLTDGEGMYLRIYPNGSKYWQLQYWFEGKQKVLSFGAWPEVGLTEAREKRVEARKKRKQGIDPIKEKLEKIINTKEQEHEKEIEDQRKGTTFEKVAQEWYKRQAPNWTEKHSLGVLNSLNNHVFPDLGEKPISDITKQDVIKTFRKLESAGMHETRARVGQRVVAVFEYAEIEEHCIGNPAVGLNKIFTKPKPKHFPSLPISELAEFLHKVEADTKATPITKLAILFMIHVFVRSKSQRHAKWIDIDLDCAEPLWIVPSSDMKKGRELHVPLSPQVVKIFEELNQFSDQTGYVFPQAKDPKKVMSENTLQKFSIKIGYKGRSTIHGFRTVASTALHESMIWKYEVVEKQMSHLVGSETSRAYNRAEHLVERRKMLEWWSDYIEKLISSQ